MALRIGFVGWRADRCLSPLSRAVKVGTMGDFDA
jgi:hypothetical protein